MIQYTVMPLEVVMEGIEEMESNQMEIVMNGITMQVQPLNSTQATIVRLISGNPQDFLNPQFTPGRVIEFQPRI
ncbi:YlzJ-like family protein [Paenibacillus sp. UNC451MF]|uniref:YlzJ-like family protein n=1 Tax=Paenibacillus sp. UNC451MF TaxID=1449063 RepID=UPI00048CFBF3|nr:YlzJ-like family protein [Paenibacillus sp. UNC451MF]